MFKMKAWGGSGLRLLWIVGLLMSLGSLSAAKKSSKSSQGPRELAVELGAPFHDHAILQRGMKVPVWGWSAPGTKVTVSFSGQNHSSKAGQDGKWMIHLDPLKANAKAAEMVITEEGGKTETLKDILVGEVWLASGQSNMQWPAGKTIVGRVLQKGIKERVEAGQEEQPLIREVLIPGFGASLNPQEKSKASWHSNWSNFSAIAFAFAYEVQRELKIPVGIVNCSFSSTPIEAWAHRDGYRDGKDQFTKDVYQRILESDPSNPAHKKAWDAYNASLVAWGKESADLVKQGRPATKPPQVPGILNGNRGPTWLYNAKTHPMAPYALRGVIWNQGYANSNGGFTYRNYLHSLVRSFRIIWGKPDLPVYFNQFYGNGNTDGITLNSVAEMRLGTWIAHKELSGVGMASQIDVTGGVHYYQKAIPGFRLAYHALKNQYGKDVIANGPMYKDYTVKGNKLILKLDHAQGLRVGQLGSGIEGPTTMENAEDQVDIFYLAGKDKKWYQAKIKIVGETIELTAPGLSEPVGVAYGCNAVGARPNIYNKGGLPLTPFIYYEKKLVLSDQHDFDHIAIPDFPLEVMTWPLEYIPLGDREVDPTTYGLRKDHHKLALLSPQFRNGGVIQADVPTRLYGAAIPGSVVKVKFAGVEKTVQVGPYAKEWEATFDALKASNKPLTIYASCTLDGKLAHERTVTNILVGDVWYVSVANAAMPNTPGYPNYEEAEGPIRMFQSRTKKGGNPMPDRFKLTASGTQKSRFYAIWGPAYGLAKILGEKIHAKTGHPVGIIVMNTKGNAEIKEMVGYEWLDQVPEWKGDKDQLYSRYAPDPTAYSKNAAQYIEDWKGYWKRVVEDPAFSRSNESGARPAFPGAGKVETKATMVYNLNVVTYGPANFKGVISFNPDSYMGDNEGASFGKEFTVMANCWKGTFARGKQAIDPHFVYTLPAKELAPKITAPSGIVGASTAVPVSTWTKISETDRETRQPIIPDDVKAVLDAAVKAVYP